MTKANAETNDDLIAIRVIERQGEAALVEWMVEGGDFNRGIVPIKSLTGDAVRSTILSKAIPHGVKWEKFITLTASVQDIGRELRRRGIFTIDDLNQNPTALQKAIIDSLGKDISAFFQAVQKER